MAAARRCGALHSSTDVAATKRQRYKKRYHDENNQCFGPTNGHNTAFRGLGVRKTLRSSISAPFIRPPVSLMSRRSPYLTYSRSTFNMQRPISTAIFSRSTWNTLTGAPAVRPFLSSFHGDVTVPRHYLPEPPMTDVPLVVPSTQSTRAHASRRRNVRRHSPRKVAPRLCTGRWQSGNGYGNGTLVAG